MPGLFKAGDKIQTMYRESIVGRSRFGPGVVVAEISPGVYQIETDMGITVLIQEADLTSA